MEILKQIQLDLMLCLIGVGVAFVVLVLLSKALSPRRRLVIAMIEIVAAVLLVCDRIAYIYDGDASDKGYWMVYISNLLLFLLSPICVMIFDQYIMNLFKEDLKIRIPKRLWVVCIMSALGAVFVLVASMIPELLFYLDEEHYYHRGPAYIVCFFVPVIGSLLMAWVVIQNRNHFSKHIFVSLLLFLFGPVIGSIVQIFTYGFSLGNLAIMITSILVYIFAYLDINARVANANRIKIESLEEQKRTSERLFEQTATALANAIDAKDEYTRGHSLRVAEYSEKIARVLGKNDEECREVYYTALLHDVGKIGISDQIITKAGRLTDEEYEAIKQHPVIGSQILSSIRDYPYLSIGAHYHHERYDGKGYPDHLKGEDIPEIARIIAVADAYDAMTSNRSYRAAIPQQIVREEILKNAGTQFDPKMAKIMQHLIDLDSEYTMQEKTEATGLSGNGKLQCEEYGDVISEGILLSSQEVTIRFHHEPGANSSMEERYPSIILFDSLDARFYHDERNARNLACLAYAMIRLDGMVNCVNARKTEVVRASESEGAIVKAVEELPKGDYRIRGLRLKDHARITIENGTEVYDVILALPDATRYAYIGLTGAHCTIDQVSIDRSEQEALPGSIPRIAEEVSFIQGNEGDMPNVQVDNFRSASSKGIPIHNKMKLTFHSMSLPSARLIWHCPYLVLFYSDDGEVQGKNYREYGLVRLDGEYWDGVNVKNTALVTKTDFQGWEAWKKSNKEGIDVEVFLTRDRDEVWVKTENLGISVENTTKIIDGRGPVYVALSGDQCAITNIRIHEDP